MENWIFTFIDGSHCRYPASNSKNPNRSTLGFMFLFEYIFIFFFVSAEESPLGWWGFRSFASDISSSVFVCVWRELNHHSMCDTCTSFMFYLHHHWVNESFSYSMHIVHCSLCLVHHDEFNEWIVHKSSYFLLFARNELMLWLTAGGQYVISDHFVSIPMTIVFVHLTILFHFQCVRARNEFWCTVPVVTIIKDAFIIMVFIFCLSR